MLKGNNTEETENFPNFPERSESEMAIIEKTDFFVKRLGSVINGDS